jgi:undecaprenyl diphosphate synthase
MILTETKLNKDYQDLIKQLKIDLKKLPEHVALIMDGNGRWASGKSKSRYEGHLAGTKVVKELVKLFRHLEIPVMTLFAFSTENWQRPFIEVSFLMDLFEEFIEKECLNLKNNGIKLRFIGEISGLRPGLQRKIAWAENITKDQHKLTLNIAINYGGRTEIINAVKKIADDLQNNKLKKTEINEKIFNNYLYTANLPEPDLLIRTSGEMRISNYLLWQIAYSEIWVTDTLWPDFTGSEFLKAISDYQGRSRRFGKVG